MMNKETVYTQDVANKKINVVREFDAPVEAVWKAWTQSEMLEQWWAPKPYKAVTKTMDFRPGGFWFYYMLSPDGQKHYARLDYESITANKSFEAQDGFCDETGKVSNDMPSTHWKTAFDKSNDGTKVEVELVFASESDMNKLIETGFKDGFAMAHKNLDEVLAR